MNRVMAACRGISTSLSSKQFRLFGALLALLATVTRPAPAASAPSLAPSAQEIIDTAWELAQRAEELMRFAADAKRNLVAGWDQSAPVWEIRDAVDGLATLAAQHAGNALADMESAADVESALAEIAVAAALAEQAEIAASALSAAAGLPPAVPGGAEWRTALPVPDGKFEGWIVPEEALAAATLVEVDPGSAEGNALQSWRDTLDANAEWLGERVLVEDLYVKDPIIVSELLSFGPRWLGTGGFVQSGVTIHLHNVWVIKTADVYEAVKHPELLESLELGGWDAGATAWDCGDDAVYVPAIWEGEKVICETRRVSLPFGIVAPDGRSFIEVAQNCALVPEKIGECRPLPGWGGFVQPPAFSELITRVLPAAYPADSYPPLPSPDSFESLGPMPEPEPLHACGNDAVPPWERDLPTAASASEPALPGPVPEVDPLPELDGPFVGDAATLNSNPQLSEAAYLQMVPDLADFDAGPQRSGDEDARYQLKLTLYQQSLPQ